MKFAVLAFCFFSFPFACGSDDPQETIDCTTVELSYENFGASFMDNYCTDCHSSSLTGADRQSATVGIDFDTHDDVRNQSASVKLRTVDLKTMPPVTVASKPSAMEIADLAVWLECGAP